jgi:hypothetical protein
MVQGDFMQKRYMWLAAPGVLAGALFAPRMVASPEALSQAYFAVQR